MSNLKGEITEPEPTTTSLPNEASPKEEVGEPSATINKEVTMESTESEAVKTDADVKEERKAEENETTKDFKQENSDKNGSPTVKKERFYDNGVLKTTARIDESDVRKNYSKYDPGVLPPTDDPSKIRAQVEFYFSDANLPTDSHLWKLTDGESNLPVSIKDICLFGRMKRFQPISTVVDALKQSKFLDVSGPEGEETVNRKTAYSATAVRPPADPRSVYVKGFGDEEPSSQFDIEAFFAQFGPTNAVRLRRTAEKLFKGSVFVEFADEETAKNFLTLEPKPLWKSKYPLKIQSKKEYMDDKLQDIKDGKVEPAEAWGPKGRGYRGNHRGQGHHRHDSGGRGRGDSRGDRDPDDWKKRREEDRANGFKDDRYKRDRGRRDGDRKGGRGGRGRGREEGGRRSNDRNRDRGDRDEKNEKKRSGEEEEDDDDKAKKVDSKAEESPAVKTENSLSTNGKKRAREDGDAEQTPTKKADSKSDEATAVKTEDSPASNGKKRAREDDGEAEPAAKKVDTKSEVTAEAS